MLLLAYFNKNIMLAKSRTFVTFEPLFQHNMLHLYGGGPRVVVSTAAFHARVRGFFRSRRFEINKNVSSPSTRETQYCGEPPWPRGIACSASDLKGLNFKNCVWRTVSSHSSHHPQKVQEVQNFHSLDVMSRWRDPQLQVIENYSDLTKWRLINRKSGWLMPVLSLTCLKCDTWLRDVLIKK